jgi:hypothetical protein
MRFLPLHTLAAIVLTPSLAAAQANQGAKYDDLPKALTNFPQALIDDAYRKAKSVSVPPDVNPAILKGVAIPCTRPPPNFKGVVIPTPRGTRIFAYRIYMANFPWARGGCRADLPPRGWQLCQPPVGRSKECSIGWSKVVVLRADNKELRVRFDNWKHDNHRGGLIIVWHQPVVRIPRAEQPTQTKK